MSYHSGTRPALQRYGVGRPQAMDGILSDLGIAMALGPIGWVGLAFKRVAIPAVDAATRESMTSCLAKANHEFLGLEGQINDLRSNWKPTGFYTADDIAIGVSQTMTVVVQAISAVSNAPDSASTAAAFKTSTLAELQRKAAEATKFTSVGDMLRAQNGVVDAPGFKNWIITTLNAALQAQVGASILSCRMTLSDEFIAFFSKVWRAAVAVIKTIAGVAYDLAKALGKIIIKVPDTLLEMMKYAKWGALAAVGYLVFTEIQKRQ